uniref:Uncharacterized protein n=1 Tax=Octopus bimaculoides TaxID=37653 RepID=A0A0L8HY44_OCTBM
MPTQTIISFLVYPLFIQRLGAIYSTLTHTIDDINESKTRLLIDMNREASFPKTFSALPCDCDPFQLEIM